MVKRLNAKYKEYYFKDYATIENVYKPIELAQRYAEELTNPPKYTQYMSEEELADYLEKTGHALVMNFQVITETLGGLSKFTKLQYFTTIDFDKFRFVRNLISHNYRVIDLDIIRYITSTVLPSVKRFGDTFIDDVDYNFRGKPNPKSVSSYKMPAYVYVNLSPHVTPNQKDIETIIGHVNTLLDKIKLKIHEVIREKLKEQGTRYQKLYVFADIEPDKPGSFKLSLGFKINNYYDIPTKQFQPCCELFRNVTAMLTKSEFNVETTINDTPTYLSITFNI